MMERLSTKPALPAPPAATPVETIDEIRAKLFQRVSPALTVVWPTEAPLSGFDLTLSDKGVTLDVQYESHLDLSPIALGIITKQLQNMLNLPTLVVEAHRVRGIRKRSPERKTNAR